ncbi:hypothetical protein EON63_03630 [archaeon]|nr:MAG: hypothetical protein EON63_03630 [archaeon]
MVYDLRYLLYAYSSYDSFFYSLIGCTAIAEQVQKMREAVKLLPPAHFNCLKFVIEHLKK